MRTLLDFIKATAVGGLIVIVPLSIVLFALSGLLETLIKFGSALEAYLPFGWLGNSVAVAAAGLFIIILLCFVTGLILLTGPGKRLGNLIRTNLAEKIPMYGMLQSLTAQFAGISGEQLQPVEADIYGSGSWVLGFIVETLPDGRLAIFVPSIPVATVGQIYYIGEERVRRLDVEMMDVVNAITQWGVGSKILFEKPPANVTSDDAG